MCGEANLLGMHKPFSMVLWSFQEPPRSIIKQYQKNNNRIYIVEHVFSKFPQVLIEKHRRFQSRGFQKMIFQNYQDSTLIQQH